MNHIAKALAEIKKAKALKQPVELNCTNGCNIVPKETIKPIEEKKPMETIKPIKPPKPIMKKLRKHLYCPKCSGNHLNIIVSGYGKQTIRKNAAKEIKFGKPYGWQLIKSGDCWIECSNCGTDLTEEFTQEINEWRKNNH